jgi:uncharacterized protein (TIGR02271 family)
MTMHADQLVGAPVIDSDGQAVGTIEQVFRDDVDGTPSWARIRSGKGLHFVPLAGSSLTSAGGLTIPFDSQKIMKEPELSVDRHMSVAQEEELRSYFGLSVPAQAPPGEVAGRPGDQAGQAGQSGQSGQAGQAGQAGQSDQAGQAGEPGQAGQAGDAKAQARSAQDTGKDEQGPPNQPAQATQPGTATQRGMPAQSGAGQSGAGQSGAGQSGAGQSGAGQSGAGQSGAGRAGAATKPDLAQPGAPTPRQAAGPGMTQPGSARQGADRPSQPARPQSQSPMTGGDQEWLVRSEERLAVDLETRESGRVKLHKHIDTEPVQQTVHVSHEEYQVERVPISGDDQVKGELADREQELVLHETRAVINKETVPVERVRLSVKKVEEDKTISDQLRKERIEIDSSSSSSGQPAVGTGGNAAGGRDPASGRDSGKRR